MPYDSVKDTPAYVQKLGATKARQWMHIVNQCLADGKPESKCFAMANGVVKRKAVADGETWVDDSIEAEANDDVLDLVERAYGSPAPDDTPTINTFTTDAVKSSAHPLTGLLRKLGLTPQPIPVTRGEGLLVTKQADGRLRWVARYSNAWQDRDREIVTEAAHKEYVGWLYEQKAAGVDVFPELWLWHTPGTRFGAADWVDFADGFAHASGLIDDTPAAQATVTKLTGQRLGVSHGMICKQVGKYITGYRSFEISVLPLERASVWTTDFNVASTTVDGSKENVMAFTAERRKWLVDALGEPAVVQLEANTGAVAAQLKQLGVDYKSIASPEPGDGASTGAGDAQSNVTGVAATTLAQQIADLTNAVQGIAGAVAQVQKDVAEVKKGDDDKIADAFMARISRAVARPSNDESNVVPDGEARAKAAAGAGVGTSGGDFLGSMVAQQFGLVKPQPGAAGNSAATGTGTNGAAGTAAAAQVQIQ